MRYAQQWLENEGFVVIAKSRSASFDFEATKENQALKIEVNGTTSEEGNAILMTHREIQLHRSKKGATSLIVVSQIRLMGWGSGPHAAGGCLNVDIGWDIDIWLAKPIAFKLTRPVS